MPRIRTIKPEFFTHEGLAELPFHERLAFIGLWTLADVAGRLEDRPKRIRAEIFPYDNVDMDEVLAHLDQAGFIRRYSVDGRHFIQIDSLPRHQHFTGKEATLPPKYPGPDEGERPGKQQGTSRKRPGKQVGSQEQVSGIRYQVSGIRDQEVSDEVKNTSSSPRRQNAAAGQISVMEVLYQQYPRKEGHGAAIKAIDKALARLRKGEPPKPPMTTTDAQAYLSRQVEAYACSPAGSRPDREMIPHPATWFNQSRYLDDENAWQHTSKPNGGFNGKSESFDDIAEEIIRGHRTGADEDGELPWGEEGPGPTEGVCETPGAGER